MKTWIFACMFASLARMAGRKQKYVAHALPAHADKMSNVKCQMKAATVFRCGFFFVLFSHAPCSIEAVGAESAFGQTDGFDQGFELVETECGQPEALSDFFHQTLILG